MGHVPYIPMQPINQASLGLPKLHYLLLSRCSNTEEAEKDLNTNNCSQCNCLFRKAFTYLLSLLKRTNTLIPLKPTPVIAPSLNPTAGWQRSRFLSVAWVVRSPFCSWCNLQSTTTPCALSSSGVFVLARRARCHVIA